MRTTIAVVQERGEGCLFVESIVHRWSVKVEWEWEWASPLFPQLRHTTGKVIDVGVLYLPWFSN